MSEDIWHTSNEKPEVSRYYLEEYEKFSGEIGYIVNKQYGNINTIDDLTTKRWCYLDDLLALETENKDLSDKIGKLETELERTRKALDVAKDTIRHADWFFDGDYNVDAKTMHNEIKCAIKAITALEQKE